MKTLSESIIGRKGSGPFRSIIIVPMESDYLVCSRSLYYATSFKFGEDNIWTGFATEGNKAKDVLGNIALYGTKIFVSNMDVNDFIKAFEKTNKESRSVIAVGAPKSHFINPPERTRQITLDELRDIVKKYK